MLHIPLLFLTFEQQQLGNNLLQFIANESQVLIPDMCYSVEKYWSRNKECFNISIIYIERPQQKKELQEEWL